MKKKTGFTVVEILLVIIITLIASFLVIRQKEQSEATNRDRQRKTAINAMYFQLTRVFYKQNNYYPENISPEILSGMDPALFTDPKGVYMKDTGSDYSYQASDCEDAKCKKFKLSAVLEKEAIYTKDN